MTSQTIDKENFMKFLKRDFPHLYDVQTQVERVIDTSGFGDVSIVLQITHGVVDRGEILGSSKRIYYLRRNNKLERKQTD